MTALVSVFAAPTAGLIMDKAGLIAGAYFAASMILVGQLVMTMAASTGSYKLMMLGRFVFGCGFEPMNVVKGIVTAKWFIGRELSFACNLNLSVARLFVFFSGYCTPWVTLNIGYSEAFLLGCGFAFFSWLSTCAIANL